MGSQPLPLPLLAPLEWTLNRALRLDPDTAAALAALDGQVVKIQLRGLNWELFLCPSADGVRLKGHYPGAPDATLRGTPQAVLGMALGEDAAGSLFSGEVEIDGNVEVGQRLKQILERFEVDGEEWLARYAGDTVAHQTGRAARGLRNWLGATLTSLGADTNEFFTEEARWVVSRPELSWWCDEVDRVRDDVERAAARVARLRDATRSGPTA